MAGATGEAREGEGLRGQGWEAVQRAQAGGNGLVGHPEATAPRVARDIAIITTPSM